MQIRVATAEDTGALAKVFFQAVREGPSPYSETQRSAWVSQPPDASGFTQRLSNLHVILAERESGPVGFIGVEDTGYIDLVFILHDARGHGVFRRLYEQAEQYLRRVGASHLRTHASLLAQPAFRAVGFSVIQHETVTLSGISLPRAEMEKHLT